MTKNIHMTDTKHFRPVDLISASNNGQFKVNISSNQIIATKLKHRRVSNLSYALKIAGSSPSLWDDQLTKGV